MKKECHNCDIYSLSQLLALMRGPYVTPFKITNDDFKDWDKMINDLYRPLAPNTTKMNHVFTYLASSPGILKTQRVKYSPISEQWLVKGRKKQNNWTQYDHEQRQQVVQGSKPETIAKPGIKPIKQVEMFTKWLPLIEGKPGSEELCPKPSDEVMNMVKKSKNAKAGEKRVAKRKRALGIAPKITDANVTEGAITVAHPLGIDEDVTQPLAIGEEAVEGDVKIV